MGGHGYALLPSELEANAASAAYAGHLLTEAQLASLRAVPECAALLDGAAPPADVVEATLAALDPARAAGLRRACEAWDVGAWRRTAATAGPVIEVL